MFIIDGKIRNKKGKSASRCLRLKHKLPAILYGKKKHNLAIELDHDSVFNMQLKHNFYKKNCYLVLEGIKYLVKIKSIQRHSFKPKLLHIDFLYV
ncbi:50S ribosomal protein L25 [Buchnera aphidicola]|uniref:50S ribosomal protein L25 n=1 Tax=Buchnera aphidicola TaxID=9 RepID=UPI003464C215